MKLRRALVTAAATAAIAPIALLSAPGAFATDEPSAPETTASSPAASESTASETPDDTASPSASVSESASDTASPSASESATDTASPSSSSSATTTPSDSASPSDPSDECSAIDDDPDTVTELRGLPSKIVAGSGWHGFTYRVTNDSDRTFETVEASLWVFAYADDDDLTETTKYVHVQWSDGTTWHDVDANTEEYLPFASTGKVEPGEHTDAKLRIKVDAKAPAGAGAALAVGLSVDDEGNCGWSDDSKFYDFEILAAGTKPGTVPPAEGKPGKPKPNTPAPQSSSTPLDGSLAHTGSSSMVPTIGLVGGVAVVAGAGVMYSVRRRKASHEA